LEEIDLNRLQTNTGSSPVLTAKINKNMANEVTKVFSDMSNEELVQVIQEMKEDGPQGIIRVEGIIREKCKMVHNIVGGNIYEHMMIVQYSILQEAAYRFTPTMDELTHNV
jgi:hypothetical protein